MPLQAAGCGSSGSQTADPSGSVPLGVSTLSVGPRDADGRQAMPDAEGVQALQAHPAVDDGASGACDVVAREESGLSAAAEPESSIDRIEAISSARAAEVYLRSRGLSRREATAFVARLAQLEKATPAPKAKQINELAAALRANRRALLG
ncbi:MAG: hypothetical protein J0H09_08210 [Burkholderiales bacterium]|nr:hypothetical protein [Burkholderiales bacterium]